MSTPPRSRRRRLKVKPEDKFRQDPRFEGRHKPTNTCYIETAEDDRIWAHWDAEAAAEARALELAGDDHERTSAEWLEAARRQMEQDAEDPELAAIMQRISQSPAFLPAHPQK